MQLKPTIVLKGSSMTQRTIQLTHHGISLVIWLIALNSLYTLFSTFEKAFSDSEKYKL